MDNSERLFTLRLKTNLLDEAGENERSASAVGELWQGRGRVPLSGVLSYRGRVDAVITFYVDQFLHDEIFQPGDTLAIAHPESEASVLLARKYERATVK
ncbi:hypothetical protein EBU99_00465 [bacterium]|nr:hypothetical protein [bacterium]